MTLRRIGPGAAAALAFVLLLAVAVTWTIQTNDLIFLPAPAEAIDAHITVAGHPPRPRRGSFYITFVYEQQANLLTELYQRFNPNATIVRLKDYYGSTIPSAAQQQKESIAEMISSKQAAELAAFNTLGYAVPGEAVAVGDIDKQSHAVGTLRVNDIILAANGHPVHTPDALRKVVQALRPGTPVALLVRRPAATRPRTLRLMVRTISLSGTTVIGILPRLTFTAAPSHLPYQVAIDNGDVQGPSAGLMFALSIVNRLSPVDLTHGHKIAGTGEISPDGIVGPVGGVKQKVIGAREAGAQIFFVPADCGPGACNYRDARPYAGSMRLVPVSTLDQALDFLRHLR
jgi:PDZ domain-containing protein